MSEETVIDRDQTGLDAQNAQPAAEFEINELTRDVIDALRGRADFYDLLAYLYFRPLKAEQIENLARLDFSAYDGIDETLSEGLNDMRRYLNKRNTGTRQELAVDFTAAFAGTSSWKGRYAVPYESVFTSPEGLMYQDSYHEVIRFFKQHHVARAEGLDFPDDHLSFMCEFMTIMSNRAIDSLEAGDIQQALEDINVSRGFLADHILSWFDEFSELASLMLETRFYRGVLKVSKGFFVTDAEVLDSVSVSLEEMLEEEGPEQN